MYKLLLTIVSFLFLFPAVAQTQDEILAEGFLLYNSERASWLGTDLFMAKFPDKKDKIGGYLSYSDGDKHKCIFYDKDTDPGVLATITFDDSFVVEVANVNTDVRKLNSTEKDLYIIRTAALAEINKDTLFERYENTNFNLIPMIIKEQKKVYILTGPENNGVLLFGNDYLITFDKKNTVKTKKRLHNNLIVLEYGKEENQISSIHSHNEKTGDLITATDICTLLLYGPYTPWKTHYVISKGNVSIWDIQKEELIVMTRKAWDRMNESQDKKK